MFLDDFKEHLQINGGISVVLNHPDYPKHWLKLLILLYADETIILSDKAAEWHHRLNSFKFCCNAWKHKVNIAKTNVISFNAKNTKNYEFKLGTQVIEITKISISRFCFHQYWPLTSSTESS